MSENIYETFRDIVTQSLQKDIPRVATRFPSLNEILGGGIPTGRITEIYGPPIGKSGLALNMFEHACIYFDMDRKLCEGYVGDRKHILVVQGVNNDELFNLITELISLGVIIIIDSLGMVGSQQEHSDKEHYHWLMSKFSRIQRFLIDTTSTVIVANQIRVVPGTGRVYSLHDGVIDPAVKIKVYTAEQRPEGRLVYLDIERCYWGGAGKRCTLMVTKEEVRER